MEQHHWTVEPAGSGLRLDQWLVRREAPGFSRSAWQRLIREGRVRVNGAVADAGSKLRAGDRVEAAIPPPVSSDLEPEAIPLDVLYEDADILVINKPPGLVVHPAAGNRRHTLVHALLHHCAGSLSGIGGIERPGLVHRLDADTSGCLVIAKNDPAHRSLAAQFKTRSVEKIYRAWVWGEPSRPSGRVDRPIGRHPVHRKKMAVTARGKPAITEWKVLKRAGAASLVECRLLTGRTHQIRVHLAHLGHPVAGDPVYGRSRSAPGAGAPARQLLHACLLGFEHPRTGRRLSVEAPLPADFKAFEARLGARNPPG